MCVLCVYYMYVHACMHKHTHAYECHSMRVEEGRQLAGVTSPGMVGSAFAHWAILLALLCHIPKSPEINPLFFNSYGGTIWNNRSYYVHLLLNSRGESWCILPKED